jgi:hypothetical protein
MRKKESTSFLKKGGARPAGSNKPYLPGPHLSTAPAPGHKSFLLLFFKKEVLSSSPTP